LQIAHIELYGYVKSNFVAILSFMVNNFQEQGSDDPAHRQLSDFEQEPNSRHSVGGAASY
jgi:hypothetical protein